MRCDLFQVSWSREGLSVTKTALHAALVGALVVAGSVPVRADPPAGLDVPAALKAGTQCREVLGSPRCEYRIGRLFLLMTTIGPGRTTVSVLGADDQAGYVVRWTPGKSCVSVEPGEELRKSMQGSPVLAYVSTTNGQVFRARGECERSSR